MQDKLKILIIFSILMICASGKNVYGYTGKGTANNPYVVSKEWEFKKVMTQKSKADTWVYIAVNDDILITDTIIVEKGMFRLYAKGATRSIKRTADFSADVNNQIDPQYCMKIVGNAQVVFGYNANNNVLKLDGNKDNISQTIKTSGWFNISPLASVTIDEKCHITNVRNNESIDSGAPIRTEGKLTINGEISNCQGVNGGAIKAYSGEVIVKSRANIYDCISQTEGGAIHVSAGGEVTIEDGKIHECMSNEEGGAIFISGNSRGNIVGGHIYSNLSKESAGGVFSGYGATLVIGTTSGIGPNIYNNKAYGSGGGVRCNGGITEKAGGNTYFLGGNIYNNYSGNNGGGIACGEPGSKGISKIIMKNIIVTGNTCEGVGGGIWLPNKAKGIDTDYVILDSCVISENQSNQAVGGIMVHCNVKATNNKISNNICESYGGGVFIDQGGCFTIYSGVIQGNQSGINGQGVYVQGELKIIADAYINSNNAVYLTKGTFIEIIGKLNKIEGYIATIKSAIKENGTKLIKVNYTGSDAIKELYYIGTPEDEYSSKSVTKKYSYSEPGKNKCLRPGNSVNGYDGKWIILSEKYTITFKKNCNGVVENMPKQQIKFWNENIKISSNKVKRNNGDVNNKKHWNFKKNGSGTCVMPGSKYSYNGNKKLYAIWNKNEIAQLFIKAEDRYYVVGQDIVLNNSEILKKVVVKDDIDTGKKYNAKIIQINKDNGTQISNGQDLSAEQYINTNRTGNYEITVYVKEGNVEKRETFDIYVLETLLQNGRTRFISNMYIHTLSRVSKWFGEFRVQLIASLQRSEGQGTYIIHLSQEKIEQIKQKVKSNGYKINQTMNKELAESW